MRAKSLSSPSPVLSGKSSPSPTYSGKSSPCSTIDELKFPTSSRKKLLEIKANVLAPDLAKTLKSPRINIREFIENQSNGGDSTGATAETELSNIPEESQQISWNDLVVMQEQEDVEQNVDIAELTTVSTSDQYSQTSGFEDEYLTLQQWRDKYENGSTATELPIESAVTHTVTKLDAMENEFLAKNANKPSDLINTTVALSNENSMKDNEVGQADTKFVNQEQVNTANAEIEKKIVPEEKKTQTSVPLKYSNVLNRPITTVKLNQPAKVTSQLRVPAKPSITTKTTSTPNIILNTGASRRIPIKNTILSSPNRLRLIDQSNKDANHRVPSANSRPNFIPSNTATRLAARSKTMIDLGNSNVHNKLFSRTYTANSLSRDSLGSSTSTLRASNEQIGASGSQTKLNTRKSEPRTMPTHGEDNDGWLTVKARRRTSLHWSNRFNQPTGYASLPTLALLNPNEKDVANVNNKGLNRKDSKKSVKPVVVTKQNTKLNVVKSKTSISSTVSVGKEKPGTVPTLSDCKVHSKVQQTVPVKETKPTKMIEKKFQFIVSRAAILQRQKSDITGLKLNTLRKEYFRKEKSNNKVLNGGAQKCETTKLMPEQKFSMNIQTNMGLSSAMCDLYASCLDPAINSELLLLKSSDNADKHDGESDKEEFEIDENQRKLLEEQEFLERQILELQNMEIEIDTETDDADCETILDLEETDSNHELDQFDDDMSLETRYQYLLSDMSTGERIETLATLQAFVSRHPGRAQELHQKLSSPSRRRSLHETLKKYQAKQARAQDMRDLLNKEKSIKIQTLLARVEDVKAAKQQLIEEKRLRMEERLQRYAENRNQYLKHKVRKAHDEEEKLKEIAFIKSLEAQNKRLDMMEMRKEQEGRLQDLEQERQKRMEEKAAKEAAVERRRLELAKERQKRLEKMDETRREREHRVEQMQEEKEKLRQKIAREKVSSIKICKIVSIQL